MNEIRIYEPYGGHYNEMKRYKGSKPLDSYCYVEYEDYAALQSENAKLKEMLERMAETAILIQSWSHARQRPYVNWDSEVALKLEIAIAEYRAWKDGK